MAICFDFVEQCLRGNFSGKLLNFKPFILAT